MPACYKAGGWDGAYWCVSHDSASRLPSMQDLLSWEGDWPAVFWNLLDAALMCNNAANLTAGATLQRTEK